LGFWTPCSGYTFRGAEKEITVDDKVKVDLGKKPGHPGSFVSAAAIQEKIEASRAAEEINKSQTDAEKEKADAREAERIREIDALLPEMVMSCLGEVSFETFKKWYKPIWDQIASKDHLARGYCIFENEPAPNLKIGYRTLRGNEMRILSKLSPTTLPTVDTVKYAEESYLFRFVRLALGVLGWDGTQLAPITAPKAGVDTREWLKTPEVASRIEFLESLPDEVVDVMAATLSDIAQAYRLALQENLKNRYAPL
jgi:hypothetical protein